MKIVLLLGVFLSPICLAQAQYNTQNLVSSAGDYFEATDFSISWSLGEIATETLSNTKFLLTQGFQQSFLEPIRINEKQSGYENPFKVYPNPTQSKIYILILEPLGTKWIPNEVEIYNVQGKQILLQKLVNNPEIISLESFPGAIYYMRLFDTKTGLFKTHIIQKINHSL